MVEPAQNRSDSNPTVAGLRLWNRCLQAEAAVRTIMVVVVDELDQDPAEMTFVDGNQVVEALPTDCPHQRSAIEFARGARIGVRRLLITSPPDRQA